MEKQLKELDEDESQQSVLENTEMKERYSGSPKSRRSLRSKFSLFSLKIQLKVLFFL